MAAARSRPSRATARWEKSGSPASRKPPLRPAAPDPTVPASSPTTDRPSRNASATALRPDPPRPTTQTSAATGASSPGGGRVVAAVPQTGSAVDDVVPLQRFGQLGAV